MSLKQVPLDPFLLSGLYRSSLIPVMPERGSDSEDLKAAEGVPGKLDFLGNNEKNITLLLYNETETWLSEELFTFLTNILEACKLSINDVALVNCAGRQDSNLSLLKQQLSSEKIICFGTYFEQWLQEPVRINEIQYFENLPLLPTEDLKKIREDKELKKAFWKALQGFFGLI